MPETTSLRTFKRVEERDTRDYIVSLIDDLCSKYDTEEWTDRSPDNIGMTFVEIATKVGDLLNFYVSNQANETYLTSAVQRKNLKRILDLVDYKIRGPEPARTTAQFDIDAPVSYDITIPRYFQIYHESVEAGRVYYATARECSILAGETSTQVDVVQGLVHTVNLTVNDLSKWRTTTITDENVANGSVIVEVGGTEWEQVPDILYEEDGAGKYSVYENLDDQAVIEFAYTWKSDLPGDPKTPVVIRYLTTNGATGGISAGRITNIADTIRVNGKTVSLSVNTLYDATGGADRESDMEARVKAPHIVQSRGLMTTLTDYENFAEDVPGVYKARAVDWNIEDGRFVPMPYKVNVYIVPDDRFAYIPSVTQRDYVKSRVDPYLWHAIELEVLPPEIRSVDVIVRVTTASPESEYARIRREIQELYVDFFDKFNRSFGERFTVGQLENVAKASDSVNTVEILAPEEAIQLSPIEFPRLGSLDVHIVGIGE